LDIFAWRKIHLARKLQSKRRRSKHLLISVTTKPKTLSSANLLTAGIYGLGGLLILLSGCVNPFSPGLDETSGNPDLITPQQSPEQVLQNFKYAYTFKDSVLYADLLDNTFVFEYFDPDQGTSGEFISWTREVDLRTTGRLLRAFDVIDLVWGEDIGNDVILPDSTALLYRDFNLKLSNFDLSFSAIGYARLSVQRNPDGKWRITHWVDESQL
jgi:hypothetical protein